MPERVKKTNSVECKVRRLVDTVTLVAETHELARSLWPLTAWVSSLGRESPPLTGARLHHRPTSATISRSFALKTPQDLERHVRERPLILAGGCHLSDWAKTRSRK
jgi:hypothetical protein